MIKWKLDSRPVSHILCVTPRSQTFRHASRASHHATLAIQWFDMFVFWNLKYPQRDQMRLMCCLSVRKKTIIQRTQIKPYIRSDHQVSDLITCDQGFPFFFLTYFIIFFFIAQVSDLTSHERRHGLADFEIIQSTRQDKLVAKLCNSTDILTVANVGLT